jgi:hypothetical protein
VVSGVAPFDSLPNLEIRTPRFSNAAEVTKVASRGGGCPMHRRIEWFAQGITNMCATATRTTKMVMRARMVPGINIQKVVAETCVQPTKRNPLLGTAMLTGAPLTKVAFFRERQARRT